MKRTLLAAGVLTVLACSGIAYAYVGHKFFNVLWYN